MLVLSRRVGEGVRIETSDGVIWLWVDRNKSGSGYRLVLQAPKACLVERIDEKGDSQVKSREKGVGR